MLTHALTTLSLLTVASKRSEKYVRGVPPPKSTALLLETCVNVKSAIGGGMSPMTMGMVHSAMEQGNTIDAMEIHVERAFPTKYKLPITNHCLRNWKQGSTCCKS